MMHNVRERVEFEQDDPSTENGTIYLLLEDLLLPKKCVALL
jgi:hypothetical protein